MKIDSSHLKFGERATLRQLIKAKAGQVTVREAREHCSPTGTALVVQTVGVTMLAVAISLVFLPALALALAAPFAVPYLARVKRARWLRILPREHDAELVELA